MFDVCNDAYGQNLEKAIIETIAFFDLFDFPPTASEIAANLSEQRSLTDIVATISNLPTIESTLGYYFLSGRRGIVDIRQKRYNYYCRKLKIARLFTRLFSFFPAVKTVCLANVIGSHNLRDESDIDFFIITSSKKVWQTRLYCAGLAAILSRRPTKKNKRDKICLSFYVSIDQLDLSDLKLKPADPYFDYWLRNLVLLYNKDNTYEQFLIANKIGSGNLMASDFTSKIEQVPYRQFSGLIEKLARFFQVAIMNPALKMAAGQPSGVVINNQILKLYLKDSRQEYLQKYGNKLKQIFKENN